MSKFKINQDRKGYTVWILTDMGGGYAWTPTNRRFASKQDAEKYIHDVKVGAQAFI